MGSRFDLISADSNSSDSLVFSDLNKQDLRSKNALVKLKEDLLS